MFFLSFSNRLTTPFPLSQGPTKNDSKLADTIDSKKNKKCIKLCGFMKKL